MSRGQGHYKIYAVTRVDCFYKYRSKEGATISSEKGHRGHDIYWWYCNNFGCPKFIPKSFSMVIFGSKKRIQGDIKWISFSALSNQQYRHKEGKKLCEEEVKISEVKNMDYSQPFWRESFDGIVSNKGW